MCPSIAVTEFYRLFLRVEVDSAKRQPLHEPKGRAPPAQAQRPCTQRPRGKKIMEKAKPATTTKSIGIGMIIRVRLSDTCQVSDLMGIGIIFLPVVDIRIRSELRWICDGYFFSPVSNPTGTRYFTTAVILDYEQVKMCLFCYINYDLF
jgi:hypothetical protein